MRTGTTQAVGANAINLRAQPTLDSALVGSLPVGTKVEIIEVVNGEAIDPVEPRWWYIRNGNIFGYAYFKLVAPD